MNRVATIITAAIIVSGCMCQSNNQNEDRNDSRVCNIPSQTDEEDIMKGSCGFYPYPEDTEMIEASLEELIAYSKVVSKEIDFGPDAGTGRVSIEASSDSLFHAYFRRPGKSLDLGKIAGIGDDLWMGSLSAMDLDLDGNKELLFHTGDLFDLHVFSVDKGKKPLKYAGHMCSNNGFFVTDQGVIVSRIGSQGGASLARFENGRLVITEEDVWFDKVLLGSRGFHNLEYDYDDTSEHDHTLAPMLKTGKYITCNASELFGDHVLRIDLDQDGEQEQLYMSNPAWGITCSDCAQVNERHKAHHLLGPVIERKDTIALDISEYEFHFKGQVQLSALDINGDGRYEIALTAGTPEKNSTYLYSYSKEEGVVFMGNTVRRGVVDEEGLISELER